MSETRRKIHYSEWMNRYEAHFRERAGLTVTQAFDIAHANPFLEVSDGFEDDPEGAADEEMSYWTD